MISHLTRASVKRLVALTPQCARSALRGTLVQPELTGSDEAERYFAAYLLDPAGRPLVASWVAKSLVTRDTGPQCGVAIGDDIAAIIAAPRWVEDDRLSDQLVSARYASRGDQAIAAAVARLSADRAVAMIHALTTPGPDEATLHLALLQAGLALAWRPELADRCGEQIDALLALLDRASPQPLLVAIVACLGPIAVTSERVRIAVLERLRIARDKIEGRRKGDSFLAELQALDRTRTMPDEDYFMTLPDRQVAAAAAEILGRAAEQLDREGFAALREQVLAGDLADALLPAFVDGLISAAAVSPLGELCAQLLDSTDEEMRSLGLFVAAQVPLDDCAQLLLECLDDRRAAIRARAVPAVAMLEAERAVPALLARLDDPEPEVCACAARALVDFGQLAPLAERQMPGELAVGKTRERTAAVRAALPEATIDVASTLLGLVAGQFETVEDPPLAKALASVFRARDGLAMAAAFVREIPEALPIVALALGADEDTTPVVIPEDLRVELAAVLEPIILAGDEPGMLALETLARFSLGDRRMLDTIVEAAREDGYAQYILAALAHVRLRTEGAAALLRPMLDDFEYLPASLLAAGVAGVAVPVEHRLWDRIRELLSLGTHAAAAAYTALANRHRISVDDKSGERPARSSAEGDAKVDDTSGERPARSSAEGDAKVNDKS